jgi:hypothetical protein
LNHQTNSNKQKQTTMKKVNTKIQALQAVISMLTLEQVNDLPFGPDHDSRYEARKKIIEALEILETIN